MVARATISGTAFETANVSCALAADAPRFGHAATAGAVAPVKRRAGPGVSIIVPTYREAANLRPLTQRVALAMAEHTWELLIVDDDSRDGSTDIVGELAGEFPIRIEIRTGVPRDLSHAVLHGVREARHNRLVVMDADLSHPPESIPDLLAALDNRAEIAVGSRRAQGGETDAAWSTWRRVNSSVAIFLAKPLVACADPMSGFFAIDRTSLPDFAALRPVGFKIALELMVRGRLRVVEVPITFADRSRGHSKMNWRQQLAYLRHLHRLYLTRFEWPARIASFLAVGASGFVIDVGVYFGLQAAGVEHRVARFVSFWPAVTWNWRLNRDFTFVDRPRAAPVTQWIRFVVGSLAGLAFNVGTYTALTTFVVAFDRHRFLALVCGIVLGSVVNYSAATFYAYRRKRRPPA